jgi:hypothetical protein
MRHQSRTVPQRTAWIADRAHGIVTREELLAAGVSRDQVTRRVRSGALRRVFAGVYRTGPLTTEARYMAAVKACGEGALLSGPAAAHLFSLIKGPPPPPHVTTRTERRLRGVTTRRSPVICANATKFRGIPVTPIPQILIDLAASLSFDALGQACHEAHVRGTRPEHVDPLLRRGTRGAGRLRAILHGDAPIVLSGLERGFLALLRNHGLPLPRTNRPAGAHYVDCRWPNHGLTVELDSYRYHATRHAFEQDHLRERDAYRRGDQFRRYTWGDVFERPETVLAELQPLIG